MTPKADLRTDLRPRTIGEILDAAFALYRRRFWTLLLVSTLLSLPCLAASVISAAPTGRAQASMIDIARSVMDDMGKKDPQSLERMQRNVERMNAVTTGEMFFHTVVAAVLQSIARGAMFVAMALAAWSAAVRGEIPGAGKLVRDSFARSPPAAAVQVVMTGGILLGGILGPAGLPWLLAMFVLAAYLAPGGAVLALERGPLETRLRRWAGASAGRSVLAWAPLQACATIDALWRSFRVAGTVWALARATVLVFVVYVMLVSFVSLVSFLVLAVTGSFGGMWVAQHWAEAAFLPVIGAALALWYLDLRVRREGMDLRAAIDGASA